MEDSKNSDNLQVEDTSHLYTKYKETRAGKLQWPFGDLPLDMGEDDFHIFMKLLAIKEWWYKTSSYKKILMLFTELGTESREKDKVAHQIMGKYKHIIGDLNELDNKKNDDIWNEIYDDMRSLTQKEAPSPVSTLKSFYKFHNPMRWGMHLCKQISEYYYTHEDIAKEFEMNPNKYPLEIREQWNVQTNLLKSIAEIQEICESKYLKIKNRNTK